MCDREVDGSNRPPAEPEDRRRNAADPEHELLVVNRKAANPHTMQLREEASPINDRMSRERLEFQAVKDLLNLVARKKREHRTAKRRRVDRQPAAHKQA